MSEEIKGKIVKIHYYNKDNGYTVGLFELDYQNSKNAPLKNKVFGNTITTVGNFDRQPIEDEEYVLEGKFVKNKNYGLQFAFDNYERQELTSIMGIVSYLSSDLFPGIGIKTAKTIVEILGADTITKIKENPDILMTLNIPEKQKQIIVEGIQSDQVNQEITIFFLNHGITIDMTHKIISLFGNEAIDIVKKNPYVLMDNLERFGFKKNDVFALKIGIAKNAIVRLKAAICYVLKELIYNIGNSYIEKNYLYEKVTNYLEEEIAGEDYQRILDILVEEKKIYLEVNNQTVNVFDYVLYLQEIELAQELVKLLKGERNPIKQLKPYPSTDIEKEFMKIKKETDFEYSPEQEQAIKAAFTEPIVIVTGGPGTGKTTIVHSIIKLYLRLNNDNSALATEIAVVAPTGRAAKRLKETTMMNAKTIHKFLGYIGYNKFTYNKYNRTTARLIIVDEASMMDLTIAHHLITSMHEDARLIIVGDVDQLPSVGPGQILKDLIATKEIKTVRLNKIHRQAEGSSIIQLAHSINEGIVPENILEKKDDRNFIQTDNEHLTPLLVDLVKKIIEKGKDIKKDLQILIPMYRGNVGINEINSKIQELVNPLEPKTPEIKHLGRSFRINDKVIQLVNRADKNIMNGDIGIINNINYKDLKPIGLSVVYDTLTIEYTLEELEDIALAYAVSVHKAQGSEFDIVIFPITTMHYIMLKRKLIYTAVTRAKKILFMIGDVKALQMGITKIEHHRNTILKDKIIAYLHGEKHDQVFDDPDLLELEKELDTLGEKDFGKLKISDFEDL